jgi:uncharacterized membrane protein SpoIIM required for sporulation
MISTRWLDKRKPQWKQLETLLDRGAGNGLRALTRNELQDLSLLYRQIAADLAAIRQDPSAGQLAGYLNQLLARAHNTIYSAKRASPGAVLRFFTADYPEIFRRNLNYCLFALALFVGGAAVGAVLTYQDPDFKVRILGPQMVDTIERREMWTHSIVGMKPVAASGIMTNNISVGFMAFGAGITAGLGTLYMMIFNGLLIGVIGMACAMAGMSGQLWSFVAPHGVLELPAIFIAGGAGFRLAQGLLFPGFLPRRESIARAGTDGVKLLLGSVPTLIIAGIIEAFVSPTELAVPLKFALAAALFTLFLVYLFWKPGRRQLGKGNGATGASDSPPVKEGWLRA